MNCMTMIRYLFILTMTMQSIEAYADTAHTIVLWTRKNGAFSDDQNPDKLRPMTVDVDRLKLKQRRTKDAQYGLEMSYRGVPLADVINLYKPQAHDDLMFLHFENGMAIPLPLNTDSVTRLNAFLAVEVCQEKNKCNKEFPVISKEDAYSVTDDPRPITFTWNKLSVPSLWLPNVPENRKNIFSPWHHADTLTGIEFVNSKAYYSQFAVGESEGQHVFQERCQFCHGVRYVGANFGWDFVKPLPLYAKRPPNQLLNHVKYPKARAKDTGLMMPTQTDVTLSEMKAIWKWMRKTAQGKLPAYKP